MEEGYEYAVGIDLERFFDTVNQSYLIELLSHTIKEGRVISLIHKYLYAGVMVNGVYQPTTEGTPPQSAVEQHCAQRTGQGTGTPRSSFRALRR